MYLVLVAVALILLSIAFQVIYYKYKSGTPFTTKHHFDENWIGTNLG